MKRLFRLHRIVATVVTVIIAGLIVSGGVYASLGGAPKQSASGDIDLQKNLVGWWKLDGNAKDATPYANNGTAAGGAALTTDRKAKANSAYTFDGTNDEISTTDKDYFSPSFNDMTVSVWARVPSGATGVGGSSCGGAGRYMVAKGVASNWEWDLEDANNTKVCFNLYQASGSAYATASYAMTVNDNNWHHYLATIDYGVLLTLYIDGVQVDTDSTFSGTMSNGTRIVEIGRRGDGNFLTGDVDDARIYNRLLNTAEISALYKSYGSGLSTASGEKSLVGWWKLDGNAKDFSPYSGNGTVTGAALSTDRKGSSNSAYTFDGVNDEINLTDSDVFSPSFNDMTISFWARIPTGASATGNGACAGPGKYMLSKGGNTNNWEWAFENDGNTLFCLVLFNAAGGTTYATAGYAMTVNDNQWHNYVAKIDYGTQVDLYVDGVLATTTSTFNNSMSNGSQVVQIGRRGDGSFFPGDVDDVRIYSRLLATAEIVAQYGSYNSQVKVSDLQKGLVGYWPLNGNAKDATPYENNGTVTVATLTTDLKSRANSAYSFNGSTAYIDAGTGTSLNLGGSVSVFAWIKPSSIHDTNNYIASRNGSGGARGYGLYIANSADRIRAIVFDSSGGYSGDFDGNTTLVNGTWYHVGFTSDGTTMILYVNGVSDGSNTSRTLTSTSASMLIGEYASLAAQYAFAGTIDDVRVYDRALSVSEAKALYNLYK